MFGADASIVWVDDEQGPQAVDYHLSAYTQCRGGEGACPDTEDSSGTCTDDVTLVGGVSVDGQQCVTFTRNFAAGKTTIFPSSLCTTVYDVMSHVQGMRSVTCLWIQTMRTNTLCGEWVDWEKLPSNTSSELIKEPLLCILVELLPVTVSLCSALPVYATRTRGSLPPLTPPL
jgi:hypothetical protein